MKTAALTLLTLVFFILHQDVWNWRETTPLVLGFLPVGLAYHAGYSLCAAGLMVLLVKYAWPRGLDPDETQNDSDAKQP